MDEITLPGMILQPIIENSVNYGIRNIDWQGVITLNIFEKVRVFVLRLMTMELVFRKKRFTKL